MYHRRFLGYSEAFQINKFQSKASAEEEEKN
jgi:hypothetical protein